MQALGDFFGQAIESWKMFKKTEKKKENAIIFVFNIRSHKLFWKIIACIKYAEKLRDWIEKHVF